MYQICDPAAHELTMRRMINDLITSIHYRPHPPLLHRRPIFDCPFDLFARPTTMALNCLSLDPPTSDPGTTSPRPSLTTALDPHLRTTILDTFQGLPTDSASMINLTFDDPLVIPYALLHQNSTNSASLTNLTSDCPSTSASPSGMTMYIAFDEEKE
uniref:Uncharacterized protein n=1 Tax=Romanomermis culicivorax TaxID=13658 RepID=A0A915KES3_ROMCU